MKIEISIRHSTKHDAETLMALYAEPQNYANTLQLPFPNLQKWESFAENASPNFYSLVAEVDGQVVGQIGLDVFTSPRRKHVGNIGMGVLAQWQGKGIGSALLEAMCDLAFNWLALKRVELEVYTDNPTAIALYEKYGFDIEGTAKQYAFRNGEYVDVYLMAKVV
ncbi:GNAT family N-acetyltransferase [Aestuariibacter sp. AA17]|uniref:GNAT family N-acetyltransferase n=1 Tax=Fluctibacter corallii TaxID=2984329 RepID=A0ABT3AB56_9ALTE|nr:GNAT family N-acetyltransferase [Aestuariibacter sp. AA17]MCV2885910.1 GNAT family N-acetyltransferase [Aestuariibacter sp. AA17]